MKDSSIFEISKELVEVSSIDHNLPRIIDSSKSFHNLKNTSNLKNNAVENGTKRSEKLEKNNTEDYSMATGSKLTQSQSEDAYVVNRYSLPKRFI